MHRLFTMTSQCGHSQLCASVNPSVGQVLAAGTQKERASRAAHARQVLTAYQGVSGRALPDTPLAHYADLAVQARLDVCIPRCLLY